MKDTTIVSTSILLTSLLAYWYAKQSGRDTVPCVMLGGFIGSVIGERIIAGKKLQKYEATARQ